MRLSGIAFTFLIGGGLFMLDSGIVSAQTTGRPNEGGNVRLEPARRASRTGQGATPDVLTPERARAVGAQLLAEVVREYGEVHAPDIVGPVDTVIRRLTSAPGAPPERIRWAVVGDTSVNAAALPGATMIINRGLIAYCRSAIAGARDVPNAEHAERFNGCIAAVVAHEMGHIALGHADSALAEDLRRRTRFTAGAPGNAGDGSDTRAGPPEQLVRNALRNSGALAGRAESRSRELAADHYGALLLLRAGWRVQDAMDLFRRFGADERPSARTSLGELTWFRDHPRSVVREAELARLRADLMRDQAVFDDALLLVEHGVLLDSAVAMLDRVIADFPDVAALRHARAAALHLAWLQSVPVRRLAVQSLAPVYASGFAGNVRGAADDEGRLTRARMAYADALRLEAHPYTLANLAVLDAYAGDVAQARSRSDAALRAMPHDTAVRINRGVVLYLAGEYRSARALFAPLADGTDAAPAAVFDYARTLLALGDSAAGRRVLQAYVAAGDAPAWVGEATALVRKSGGTGAPGEPTATLDADVAVHAGGVALGATRAEVTAAIGAPAESERQGPRAVMHYPNRGLVVVADGERGVVLIALLQPQAGDVDGVHVGDPTQFAVRRWGRAREGEDGTLVFPRRSRLIAVRDDAGRIGALALSVGSSEQASSAQVPPD